LKYLECIHLALKEGNEFMRRVYRCHLFLRRPEARHLASHGFQLIEKYMLAANHAYALSSTRFKLSPKLHVLWHLVNRLHVSSQTQLWIFSPIAFSCQMDEDLVGKVSSISKSCAIRTVHERTLRKHLVKVNLTLQSTPKAPKV